MIPFSRELQGAFTLRLESAGLVTETENFQLAIGQLS